MGGPSYGHETSLPERPPREVGLVIDIVAPTREEALAVVTVAYHTALHYQVPAWTELESLHAFKASVPRPLCSAGAPLDTDVYGCQWYAPLVDHVEPCHPQNHVRAGQVAFARRDGPCHISFGKYILRK